MIFTKKSDGNKKERIMMDEGRVPEEVVLSRILPLLSMKDVARSGAVSRTWLRYWRHTPILRFEDPPSLHKIVMNGLKEYPIYSQVLSECKETFIRWVNQIREKHTGCTLQEFQLVYYLNKSDRVFIDKCVVWALSKHVQRLVLDFTVPPVPYGGFNEERGFYPLRGTLFRTTPTLCLTSLCLKSVNVSSTTFTILLDSCAATLETLCIVKSCLIAITASSPLRSLKSFLFVECTNVQTIDIRAPNLVCLNFNGGWHTSICVFNIADASKLSSVTIIVRLEERFLLVLHSLSRYLSHLDHLKLQWIGTPVTNLVLDMNKFPVLANLKHLEMLVIQSSRGSLAPWIPFIGACPRLRKFTLEIHGWIRPVPRKNVYDDKCALRCLKTFEIRRFDGVNLDVDLANFVVERGINLQEVILYPHESMIPLDLKAPFSRLDFKLPSHVKLVIVK